MLRGEWRTLACALIAVVGLTSCQSERSEKHALHLPPDLSGADYLHILDLKPEVLGDPDANDLKEVLDVGRRNLEWLVTINKTRSVDQQLSLTSKDRALSYPIEKPNVYNKDLVLGRYVDLKKQLPPEMTDVLYGPGALPSQSKLADEKHAEWGFKVDVVYQIAVRWLMMKPYLSDLAHRQKRDIRGYYFLSRETDLETKLGSWTTLPADQKQKYREWLVSVCANTDPRRVCESEFAKAEVSGVREFWTRYSPASAKIWESFFRIGWFRSDIQWTAANPSEAAMPVLDPEAGTTGPVLKENVEDEWKWPTSQGLWQLKLNFVKGGNPAAMTHIEFLAGTTPHVIPPNKIVMNAEQPPTEYEYRWTLRHEYGHILGFPDCYHEFYDADQKAIVNYQLDTTDLMCSRRGVLKQNHYDEMKRVYYKDAP